MKNFYISVAGVLGSGKTTVCQILTKQLSFQFFEENVNDNIFLPRYYQDPETWAFHSQIFYLKEKAAQLMRVKELLKDTSVVQDTPIHQDSFTYAKAQKMLGYMKDEEYRLYMQFFDLLYPQLPQPDLIVQLDASVPVIEERIWRRGRDYEQGIDQNYLELLMQLQNEWLENHPHIPVIRINTDNKNLNLVTNDSYQAEVIENIKSAFSKQM